MLKRAEEIWSTGRKGGQGKKIKGKYDSRKRSLSLKVVHEVEAQKVSVA